MKKITLTLIALLVTCGMWQASAQSVSISPGAAIPDNNPTGIDFTLTVPDDLSLTDLDVDLDIAHSWVGDLIVTITAPDGTTSAVVVDRMGTPPGTFGCSSNNLDITLDDAAGSAIEDECNTSTSTTNPPTTWAASGDFSPNNPLSVFNGVSSMGNWNVNISDNGGGDTGTVNSIGFTYTGGAPGPPPPTSSFEFCATDTPLDFAPPVTTSSANAVTSTANPGDLGVIGTGLGEYTLANVTINSITDSAEDRSYQLQSPNGTILMLDDANGGTDGLDVAADLVFTDASANDITTWTGGAPLADYMPEGGDFATVFAGEPIDGDWFLIVDSNPGNQAGGTVNSFCVTFELSVGTPPEIFCPADFVADNDEGFCGAIVNFTPAFAIDFEDGVLDPSNVVQTGGPASGTEFPVGDTDVTFTATDSHGNQTSCTFVVTINDAEAPMAVCQAFTVILDEDGLGSMLASDIDGGSTDNCAVDSIVASQTDFTCADVGENTIVLAVSDAAGNVSTCDAIVTVVDETAPVIVCIGEQMNSVGGTGGAGEDISVGLPPVVSVISVTEDFEILDLNVDLNINHTWTGDLTITLESPAGTVVTIFEDGCSADDIITMLDDESANSLADCDPDGNGNAYPLADYMPNTPLSGFDGEMSMGDWTLTVTDGAGGDDGVLNSWGVTIGIEPIAAPPYEVDLNADGTVSVLASDLIDSVDEACGYSVTVAGEAAGSSLSTTFANDNGGALGGAVYFDVTVGATELSLESIDVHTPETAAFTMEVFAIVGGTYVGNEGDASAWTSIGTSSGTGLGEGTPSPTTLGAAVTLTANTTYAMALVMDANASHAYTNGDGSNEAFSNADLSIALGAASNVAFDGSPFAPRVWNGTLNYTGGAPSGSPELLLDCSNLGENMVEVIVTDDSGNVSTCMATVVVNDVTAPVLVCGASPILDGSASDAPGVAIPDNDPTGVTSTLTVSDDVVLTDLDVNLDITHTWIGDLTVTITSPAGTAVTVVENIGGPGFGCSEDNIMVTLDDDAAEAVQDQCASPIEGTFSPLNPLAVFNGENTMGDWLITVSDGAGGDTGTLNNWGIEFTSVNPNTEVVIELGEDGTTDLVPEDFLSEAFDACGIDVLIADLEMVTCDDIGAPITVNIFATDASGNVTNCSLDITVVDAMAPVLTCPEDESVMVDPDGTHTVADYIESGAAFATDNCADPVTITQDPVAGTILGVGVWTITFTAEDDYGNISTCEMELDLTLLGTEDNELNNAIALYPNPANEQVTISNSSNIALETAMIYDLNGKLVSQINLQNMQSEKVIDVSAYATGVYMVYITGEQSSVVKRLIKE